MMLYKTSLRYSWTLLFSVFCLVLFAQAELPDDFDNWIEESRKDWKIPGMAVGIVKDGEVLYAKGFGEKQLGSGENVDAQGIWNGIKIGSVDPGNEFRHVKVANTGYPRLTCCNKPAAIKISSDAIMKLDNVSITDTKPCVLLCNSSSSTVTLGDMNFSNNENDECEL